MEKNRSHSDSTNTSLPSSKTDRVESISEQLRVLAMVPEMNPDPVVVMECTEKIVYGNPSARRWLQSHNYRSLDQLENLLPPAFGRRFCDVCDRATRRSETYELHGRLYDLKVTPMVGERQCVLHLRDVTELVIAQRERDAFYQAIESVGNAVAITDGDGAIEYINPAFTELYGITPKEALGKNPRVINPGPRAYWDAGISQEEYDELFRSMWESLGDSGQWQGEVLNRTADGDVRPIQLIMNRISGIETDPEKYVAIATDIGTIRRQQLDARLEILETMSRLAELRDNETGHHMKRVGAYSRIVAEHLGYSRRYCRDIEQFAPLHDVGKLGISDKILLAPRKLTPEEFSVIKGHTTLGYRILADRPSLEMAAEIARDHHERFDGSGYPEGKAGRAIPEAAQIAAVSDVYDALRSDRPYKSAWTHEEAFREILALRGTHFAPTVVDAFRELHRDFQRVATEYQD